MVKRIPVGAHYGLRDWIVQRVSAVVVVGYLLFVLGVVLAHPQLDFATWKALFAQTTFRIATMVSIVAILLHAWVGVRDILMDYVACAAVRLAAYGVAVIVLLVYLIWASQILWGVR